MSSGHVLGNGFDKETDRAHPQQSITRIRPLPWPHSHMQLVLLKAWVNAMRSTRFSGPGLFSLHDGYLKFCVSLSYYDLDIIAFKEDYIACE